MASEKRFQTVLRQFGPVPMCSEFQVSLVITSFQAPGIPTCCTLKGFQHSKAVEGLGRTGRNVLEFPEFFFSRGNFFEEFSMLDAAGGFSLAFSFVVGWLIQR